MGQKISDLSKHLQVAKEAEIRRLITEIGKIHSNFDPDAIADFPGATVDKKISVLRDYLQKQAEIHRLITEIGKIHSNFDPDAIAGFHDATVDQKILDLRDYLEKAKRDVVERFLKSLHDKGKLELNYKGRVDTLADAYRGKSVSDVLKKLQENSNAFDSVYQFAFAQELYKSKQQDGRPLTSAEFQSIERDAGDLKDALKTVHVLCVLEDPPYQNWKKLLDEAQDSAK